MKLTFTKRAGKMDELEITRARLDRALPAGEALAP